MWAAAKCRHPKDAAGFTLIEVLVALVILVLALGGIAAIIDGRYRTLARAETEETVLRQARNILAELGRTRPVVSGTSAGTLAPDESLPRRHVDLCIDEIESIRQSMLFQTGRAIGDRRAPKARLPD